MTDDDTGDSLWDTSFNGNGYALQVEKKRYRKKVPDTFWLVSD
jgi:hypothetical protein